MINISQAAVVLAILSVLVGVLLLVGSLAFFGVFVRRQFPPEVVQVEEEPGVDPALRARRSAAYRLGIFVLIGLAVLTAIEFVLAVTIQSVVLLLIMALFKAGLILQYFMHLARVWSEEAHS
jgi:cytochrome c oxidase subunit IV